MSDNIDGTPLRRVDHGGPDLHLEGGGPGADRQGPQPAQVQAGAVPDDLLQHDHQHRGVQLSQGGAGVQTRVLLLPPHHLRALLHARHRVVGQLLARQPLRPRQGRPGRHHPPHHVHPDQRDLRPAAPGVLHQGYRRVDGRLSGLIKPI